MNRKSAKKRICLAQTMRCALLCATLSMLIALCSAYAEDSDPPRIFTVGIDPCNQLNADIKPEPILPGSNRSAWRSSSGATGVKTGGKEYDINLSVALKLASLLERESFNVVISRTENDVNLSNAERAETMNKANVDLWIRISCSSSPQTSERGIVLTIPSRVYASEIYGTSVALAKALSSAFLNTSASSNVRLLCLADQAAFNHSTKPVVNVGIGYLSNPQDDILLNRDAHQSLLAGSILNGILDFLEL